jgi:hypothetical protein
MAKMRSFGVLLNKLKAYKICTHVSGSPQNKKKRTILTDMQNWLDAMHVSLFDYPFSADFFCFNVYPALFHKE